MTESIDNKQVPLILGGVVAGLIIGCLVGWLAIGWWLWPVQYEGDAYSYELNQPEKAEYVAAVADSYNLNRQSELAQTRFARWTTEEKVAAFAGLFVEDQAQGKTQEAQMVVDLATELSQSEGWDPAVVQETMDQLVSQYEAEGATQQVQLLMLFANNLGMVTSVPGGDETVQAATTTQSKSGLLRLLLILFLVVLVLFVLVLLIFFLLKRRNKVEVQTASGPTVDEMWVGDGAQPLLVSTSNYELGMDTFDESFSIEEADGTFRGECGMGISESLGEETPRRVTAFEVWLFDKTDIRTVTKVLMSEYAYNNDTLRNKLSARGEPILAEPGKSIFLETASLTVEAQVTEMTYGDGEPASGYFSNVAVSLVAQPKPGAPDSYVPVEDDDNLGGLPPVEMISPE